MDGDDKMRQEGWERGERDIHHQHELDTLNHITTYVIV